MTTGSMQKVPFVKSINKWGEDKVDSVNQTLGKSPPASVVSIDPTGTIVTVKIEIDSYFTLPQITCPVFGPRYVRYPLQKGDKGVLLSGDFYLGGMSGLGGGRAQLTQQFNLSNCVFFPVGNKDFTSVDDAQAVEIAGPNGVIIKTDDGTSTVTVSKTSMEMVRGNGSITMTDNNINMVFGSHSIEINDTGVIIDGKIFLTHEHTGVQGGSGTTGPVA